MAGIMDNGTKQSETTLQEEPTTLATVSTALSGNILYYIYADIFIGCVGTVANGTVLLAMLVSFQLRNKIVNLLLVNQVTLDLLSCTFLVITYALKLPNIYMTGTWGYWFCLLIASEALMWCFLNASILNLVVITIERYIKIVHLVWHKNNVRRCTCPVRYRGSLVLRIVSS